MDSFLDCVLNNVFQTSTEIRSQIMSSLIPQGQQKELNLRCNENIGKHVGKKFPTDLNGLHNVDQDACAP